MAENDRIPVDFHPAMFRIAAIAFVTAATIDVASSFIGAPHFDFTGIFVVGILSYVGAAGSGFFPLPRATAERSPLGIFRPGLALLGSTLMYTARVPSRLLPI